MNSESGLGEESIAGEFILQLRQVLTRFPKGLNLQPVHLVALGWLWRWEKSGDRQTIADRELRIQLARCVKNLDMEEDTPEPRTIIDRLMRFHLLRNAISPHSGHEYCLTRLGRNLARDLVEDVQYGTEDLCTHINTAYVTLKSAVDEGDREELRKALQHSLLGMSREAIEHKLEGIEEGVLSLEAEIKRLAGGSDQEELDKALDMIRTNREYVEEIMEAIQEGSSFAVLEKLLVLCRQKYLEDRSMLALADQGLDFLQAVSQRVEQLLVHIVDFIDQCVSYQSFIGNLSSRDRLCALQMEIMRQALFSPVHMPLPEKPRLRSIVIDWPGSREDPPEYMDMESLAALREYVPEEVRGIEAEWKEEFLRIARQRWEKVPDEGVSLQEWLDGLWTEMPRADENRLLALWYLLCDWPQWRPMVRARPGDGDWFVLEENIFVAPLWLLKK
ncbi:MAG: hypothetical protein ACLFSY_05495 [Desulfonatronovibrionaceae bacterium]